MKNFASIALLTALLGAPLTPAADELGDAIVALERALMTRLAQQQQRAGVEIDSFRSDGCSGGMSVAWQYLAGLFPPLAGQFGSKPPWEHCCTEHDKQYWRGQSRDGYEMRLRADRELRHCVIRAGQRQQHRLAQRLGVSPAEVSEAFNVSADMMYQAVRIGGGPCTGLPWRWGHGWPECNPVRDLEFD